MSDLSVMGFLNEETQQETEYNLKDAQARSDISTLNNKIGSANGIAELDANGKVPSSQSPSYVYDLIEGYYNSINDRFYEESTFVNMITPVEGKSWVDIPANKSYRWTGSVYVRVDEGVQLGETSDTAYAGNKGKANADAIAAMKNGSSIDSFGDVETALAGKVDKVQGKGLSTNDYDNTAKGIVDTVQDNIKANTKLIKDTVGWSGKNLLKNIFNSLTFAGVTYTVNANKSISTSGTATADMFNRIANFTVPKTGKYIASGVTGGSSNTYLLFIRPEPADGTSWSITNGEVELNLDASKEYICNYVIYNGTNVDGLTVYPMLRDANILDDTYEPYAGTTAFPRSEQIVLGAKNLLNNQNVVSQELNGLTFTVNDDKSVTVNGTATNETTFSFFAFADNYKIPEGKYILSDEAGYYNSNNDAAYLTLARKKDAGATNYDITTGTQSHSKTFIVNYSNYNRFSCYLFVTKDAVLDNLTFKPMLRLASDLDDTYVPYVPTNKRLNDSKVENSVAGTVENGTNASQNYKKGQHFIRNNKFCTAKAWIASGTALIKDTNYVEGDIAKTFITDTEKTSWVNSVQFTLQTNSEAILHIYGGSGGSYTCLIPIGRVSGSVSWQTSAVPTGVTLSSDNEGHLTVSGNETFIAHILRLN